MKMNNLEKFCSFGLYRNTTVGCHVKPTMKQLLTATILFLQFIAFGQNKTKPDVYDFPIPKTLEECFVLLDKTMPDDEIQLVKTLQEDSIYYNPAFQARADFFHAWKIYNGSSLTNYFNQKGLQGSFEIYETILISYHRYLNNEAIRLDEQIKKYQEQQQKDYQTYLAKTQQDTLNGIYIPKDLKDCFIQLDKVLSAKDRDEIKSLKNRDETIKYHHGLGMWLRNNWGLWGGSRLQKYFLAKKVNHPDEMSALILAFYYDWLHNNNAGWQKWAQ
jgi:hypothetical protein